MTFKRLTNSWLEIKYVSVGLGIIALAVLWSCNSQKPEAFSSATPGEGSYPESADNLANGDSDAAKRSPNDYSNPGDSLYEGGEGGDGVNNPLREDGSDPDDPNSPINPDDPNNPTPPPPEITCEEAYQLGKLETKEYRIAYPGHVMGKADQCEYGVNGNNPANTGKDQFNARRRQPGFVPPPNNQIICETKFAFEDLNGKGGNEEFEFDDVFFLTVRPTDAHGKPTGDEIILASNNDYSMYFTKKIGDMIVFQWSDLINKRFDNIGNYDRDIDRNYCFGASGDQNCLLPIHDGDSAIGVMRYNPSAIAVKQLSDHLAGQRGLDFGLIITGDGEDTDCQHNKEVAFTVRITFAVP